MISTHRSTSDLDSNMYIEVTLVIAQSLMTVRFTGLPSSSAFRRVAILCSALLGDDGCLSPIGLVGVFSPCACADSCGGD